MLKRNPGIPLDLEWVRKVQVNRPAVEKRASELGKRRTVKKQWQAAWLLKAIACTDLTTLSGDDTTRRVERLCGKAKMPVSPEILDQLGFTEKLQVAAVCVYHNFIKDAKRTLAKTPINIAAVSTGFPAGQVSLEHKIEQIKASVADGANEIDIVINRSQVLTGDWQAMYDEVAAYRKACKEAHIKTILATGDLATLANVAKASVVCMMAGADFIKTSTGKETENATLPVGLVMVRMIRDYFDRTGFKVGFKPAGGVSKAKQAIEWLILMKEELGDDWLDPHLFRFGASSLLNDIERQLEHYATGRYSAGYRHPVG